MGKGMYIGGADNLAHKVKKIYIGDANGKARKVKKVYIGDANGKARLCWQSGIDMLLVTSSAFGDWYVSNNLQTYTVTKNMTYGSAPYVTYGNDVFLTLININSSVATPCNVSTDGVNWKSTVLKDNFASLEFLNGLFVYYTTTSVYYNYSKNGLEWTVSSTKVNGLSSNNYRINAMTSAKGLNVLCSTYGSIYTTTDGQNLTLRTFYSSSYVSVKGVTYGNGRFVAVGTNSYIWYSDDGISWTNKLTVSYSSDYDYSEVVYGNGVYIAPMAKLSRIGYSTDGITWSVITVPFIMYSIVFKDKFYCVGANGNSAYSTDGKVWTTMSGASGTTYRIAYSTNGGGKYEYTY